jgi:dienelactone hydrolase
MDKVKRSYYLPNKLVTAFDKECTKSGYVRERVVAAAVHCFMNASANDRHDMFIELDEFLRRKAK